MKCHIVQDLLPNYIDGLNSEETNVEVKKHLADCPKCRAFHEKMTAELAARQETNRNINFLIKLKSKILRRNVIVSVVTCLAVLGGLVIFANAYQIPIPFDPDRMTVELIPTAVVIDEDGFVVWRRIEDYDPPKDYEYIRDVLWINWFGFPSITSAMIGRDINRDGEIVRVVFWRHAKTPWVSLFYDYDLTSTRSGGGMTGTAIYGDRWHTTGQELGKIEIFYLPIRNWGSLFNLSDEDFDAKRLSGMLIWSGMH